MDEDEHVSPLMRVMYAWRNKRLPDPPVPQNDVEAIQDGDEKTIEISRDEPTPTKVREFVSS